MAAQRLTDKAALAQQPVKDDLFMVVDVSDTTGSAAGTSKKIEAKHVITVVSKSLSSAEIQALHTTPIELIAAPGAGFGILIHSGLADNVYDSVTESSRRMGLIGYGTPTLSSHNYMIVNWMWNQTADGNAQIMPGAISTTVMANQPVKIAASLAITGDFTSTIHLSYTIIKL